VKSDYKKLDNSKVYFVTGAAGFIGFHLSRRLLKEGCKVIGLDNLNNYYDVNLKKAALSITKRLEEINIPSEYISFAIRNVACGTMNAYALGDGGPFVQKIIKKIQNGKN
jgi:nucleoside-diphosphate-sugar epimerase